MKGIKCCAECADYSLKKHKCTCGAKDPGKASDSFYADCPLDDAEPVRNGRWIVREQDIYCSECNEEGLYNPFGASKFSHFCPNCGARMDGVAVLPEKE